MVIGQLPKAQKSLLSKFVNCLLANLSDTAAEAWLDTWLLVMELLPYSEQGLKHAGAAKAIIAAIEAMCCQNVELGSKNWATKMTKFLQKKKVGAGR